MKNELWKLLDSINIYEIKEITFGSTALLLWKKSETRL